MGRFALALGSFIQRPTGGCLLWIALPARTNAARVFERCAGKGLIAAPGALFSASGYFDNYIRLNAGFKLTARRREALGILGEYVLK